VPATAIDAWRRELESAHDTLSIGTEGDDKLAVHLQERIERYADTGYGACWLSNPDIAQLVVGTLVHFDGSRYSLLAWCVMPNHVHVLVRADKGHRLSEVVQGWKSWSARRANRALGRTGVFWGPDYFDRFIRDSTHLHACRTYIRNNPVAAGLVATPEEWPWSSR